MIEDITFCQNGWEECQVTRCERHPSNIENPQLPHSYAKLYRTEYCPLDKPQQPKFVKGINVPANDTISRQAAIDAADRADYPGFAVEVVKAVTDEVVKELKQLPSAQPERCEDCVNFSKTRLLIPQPEIIRCKDCKHLFEDNKCPLRTWWTHTEDDFCSYGERKDG